MERKERAHIRRLMTMMKIYNTKIEKRTEAIVEHQKAIEGCKDEIIEAKQAIDGLMEELNNLTSFNENNLVMSK